jgi:hypothetical protein
MNINDGCHLQTFMLVSHNGCPLAWLCLIFDTAGEFTTTLFSRQGPAFLPKHVLVSSIVVDIKECNENKYWESDLAFDNTLEVNLRNYA